MLIRDKFVTNSSTSSYLVYGIAISDSERSRLINYLRQTVPQDKLIKVFSEYTDFEAGTDDPIKYEGIEDLYNYELEELVTELLPKGIALETGEDEEHYLCIAKSFSTSVQGDKVVFDNITAEDHKTLLNIAQQIDARDKDIGFAHWAVSDY